MSFCLPSSSSTIRGGNKSIRQSTQPLTSSRERKPFFFFSFSLAGEWISIPLPSLSYSSSSSSSSIPNFNIQLCIYSFLYCTVLHSSRLLIFVFFIRARSTGGAFKQKIGKGDCGGALVRILVPRLPKFVMKQWHAEKKWRYGFIDFSPLFFFYFFTSKSIANK